MTGITAILQTFNDELRIGRAVESLRCCDEVLVIDHGSWDETCKIAKHFGAKVTDATGEVTGWRRYLHHTRYEWILNVEPAESVSESLEASVWEWKLGKHQERCGFGLVTSEETPHGWVLHPAELRLVHRERDTWQGAKPNPELSPHIFEGHLLRLRIP